MSKRSLEDSPELFRGTPLSRAQALSAAQTGWQLASAGQLEPALALLEDAVVVLWKEPDVLAAYGLTLALALRPKDALPWLQKAVALQPNKIEVWVAMGEVAIELQSYDLAAEALKQCLTLDPNARHPAGVRARALIKKTEKFLVPRQ